MGDEETAFWKLGNMVQRFKGKSRKKLRER